MLWAVLLTPASMAAIQSVMYFKVSSYYLDNILKSKEPVS